MTDDKPSPKHGRAAHYLAGGSAVVLPAVGAVIGLWKNSSFTDAGIVLIVYFLASIVMIVLPIYGISALVKKRWIAAFVCLVIPLACGVLFFAAVQGFSAYHLRALATEGLMMATAARTAIHEYWASEGRLPGS